MTMKTLLSICFMLVSYVTINHAQLIGASKVAEDKAKSYLIKYGYLDKFATDEKTLRDSIKRLQYFANLQTTGRLDAPTLNQITIPRCGLEDPKIEIKRSRRYIHQGSTWKKNKLTWRLEGRGRTLGRETIRRVFSRALKFWSDVTEMDFQETSSQNPDIWVKFVRRRHGDPYPFDGEGGTLAHAFYPHNNVGLSGDVHFDDAEDYTVNSQQGRNFLWVATHELGHTLGLDHSNVREAVMYPWYTKYTPGFKLNYDDVVGVQTLYGSRREPTTRKTTTTTTTTTVKPTRKQNNRACPRTPIAAVYYNTYARLTVVLTHNDKLYFVNPKGGIRYGPIKASNYFPKSRIPEAVDAAYNTNKLNGRDQTILFSGTNYYVYEYFRYRSGPHSIYGNNPGDKNPLKLKFPRWVRKIDAAMTWHRNKRTYFFADRYYWRYNNDAKAFDRGYPRNTQNAWKGLPRTIDAAYSSKADKKTFFISGNQYYSLNDNYVRVERNYPEHIGREWLDCGGSSSNNLLSSFAVSELRGKQKKARDP